MAIFQSRLGCSSISFRHQDLPTALTTIRGLGFEEIDLGALPGVCDHVPYVLDSQSVHAVATDVLASGLRVRTVNGDIGDLNHQLTDAEHQSRMDHLDMLLTLTDAIGGRALVLPCGALDHNPVGASRRIWISWHPNSLPRPSARTRLVSRCGRNRCTSFGFATTSSERNSSPSDSRGRVCGW